MISQPTTLLRAFLVAVLAIGVAAPGWAQDKARKPSLSVKASPSVAFSPARVVVVAEFKGGADDYEEYYCLDVEWDWGDQTKSESGVDCEPYEAGQSRITRRFTQERLYRESGHYKIFVRLKKGDKVVVAGNATVRVRPGAGEFPGMVPD